jgi:hypothetical protein
MKKTGALVEWSIVEDEREWQMIQPAAGDRSVVAMELVLPAANRREWHLAAVIGLLFVLLAGAWLWHKQVRRAAVTGEIQAAAVRAVSTGPTGGGLASQQPADQPPPVAGQTTPSIQHAESSARGGKETMQPTVQIGEVHVTGNRVMAQVTVSYPSAEGEALTYRETHFFRQTGAGWQRIDPEPTLMGPWQTLESDYFTIRYRPLDLKAVTEAAPRLDQLYGKLRRDFGLQATAVTPKTTIEVVADGLPKGYDFDFAEARIAVPSPALLSVPAEMTDATVFY